MNGEHDKTCPECGRVWNAMQGVCPVCGHSFESNSAVYGSADVAPKPAHPLWSLFTFVSLTTFSAAIALLGLQVVLVGLFRISLHSGILMAAGVGALILGGFILFVTLRSGFNGQGWRR